MEASIQDIFSKTQYTLHLKSQTCEIKRKKNNKEKLTTTIIILQNETKGKVRDNYIHKSFKNSQN